MRDGIGSIWGLRVLAVVVAIFLWFTVADHKREGLSEKVLDVTVSYNTPRGFILLNPVEKVRVRFRGPTSKIFELRPDEVETFVEVPPVETGVVDVQLRADHNIRLPDPDLEVVSVEPSLLHLELDREINRQLKVVPQLVGEPAAGAKVGDTVVTPPLVMVRGPSSHLTQGVTLSTTPIRLDQHALDFEETVAVTSSDPLVQVIQPQLVTVRIPLNVPGAATAPGKAPKK